MELYQLLEKYKGKSIEEVILIEKEKSNKIDLERKEEIRKNEERKDYILSHQYFKIDFNGLSISYVKVKSISPFVAEEISTYVNEDKVSMTKDSNRTLNILWFIDEKSTQQSVTDISKEDFEKMKNLFESSLQIVANGRL